MKFYSRAEEDAHKVQEWKGFLTLFLMGAAAFGGVMLASVFFAAFSPLKVAVGCAGIVLLLVTLFPKILDVFTMLIALAIAVAAVVGLAVFFLS